MDVDEFTRARLRDIAEEVAHEINSSPMTQAKIGEISGMSRAHVNNMAKGTRNLTLETAIRLGFALEFDVKVVHPAAADSFERQKEEVGLLVRFRDLSPARRRYVLQQLEIARHLPDEAAPVAAGQVGAWRTVLEDDDSDLP